MLSIVSWNIQYGKGADGLIDMHRIADVIQEGGLPDILCLQEVSRNDPDTANGSDQVNELKTLFPNYEL
ncbi:MAG: endonuclease/exonuclease/phosphatase family protein, partial [SAR324 cluster bacterium]|nr:endonuclease/exonuclease/phosphatase family protein [SAR324 cluster bacterium]